MGIDDQQQINDFFRDPDIGEYYTVCCFLVIAPYRFYVHIFRFCQVIFFSLIANCYWNANYNKTKSNACAGKKGFGTEISVFIVKADKRGN